MRSTYSHVAIELASHPPSPSVPSPTEHRHHEVHSHLFPPFTIHSAPTCGLPGFDGTSGDRHRFQRVRIFPCRYPVPLLISFFRYCSGLGYEAAKTLSKFNPSRLILAVRNTGLGEKAAQEIVEANEGKGTVPEVWTLDLGRLQSVKDFAERVDRELERLDIVVSVCWQFSLFSSV
jgi:hypothetical protein